MNPLAIVAVLFSLAIFVVTVATSTKDISILLDPHGALIVLGGTAASGAIAFQLDRIPMMMKTFFVRVLKGRKCDYKEVIQDLMDLAETYRKSPGEMAGKVEKLNDHFMKECLTLFMDDLVSKEDLFRILNNRVMTVYHRYKADATQFQSIGKFPPAMGLMGAVLGMIALLGSLGEEGAQDNIGPAMSVALVATFYGIALANLIIIPIAENLTEAAKEVKLKNLIIVEGVKLISQKQNPIVLAEELNSFLLAKERIDWKKGGGGSAGGKAA